MPSPVAASKTFQPFADKAQLAPIINEFMKPKPSSPNYLRKASPFLSATTPKNAKVTKSKIDKAVELSQVSSVNIIMEYPAETSVVFPTGLSLQRSHFDANGASKIKPTGLTSDTVNWINKRRPKTSAAIPGYIMPSLAEQLSGMFDCLDNNGSGSIDLRELRDAIHRIGSEFESDYEAYNMSGSAQGNPIELLRKFFVVMDRDRNGAVDFSEFVGAMSLTSDKSSAAAINTGLKHAFYDFASQLRRRKVLDAIEYSDGVGSKSMPELQKLFSINYFLKDTIYDGANEAEKYATYVRDMQPREFLEQRQVERDRAKSALKVHRNHTTAAVVGGGGGSNPQQHSSKTLFRSSCSSPSTQSLTLDAISLSSSSSPSQSRLHTPSIVSKLPPLPSRKQSDFIHSDSSVVSTTLHSTHSGLSTGASIQNRPSTQHRRFVSKSNVNEYTSGKKTRALSFVM